MKIFYSLACLLVALTGVASASPTYCIPGTTANVAAVGQPPSGATVTCGTTVFSNFTITDAGNAPNAFLVYIADAGTISNGSFYDPSTGFISLIMNPNLNSHFVTQDAHVTFDVMSPMPIYSVTGNSGIPGIQEVVCPGNGNVNPDGSCIVGSQIGVLAYPPQATAVLGFNDGTISVWKDVSHDAGTSQSGFSQGFQTSGVPEPATLGMIGIGLLAFGWGRKRISR